MVLMLAHNDRHTNKRGDVMKQRLATMKVTKEQREWLEKEADRTGRTITEVVRSLIRQAMEKGGK